MGALYIKDSDVAEMVADLAARLGTTKTELVRTLAQHKLSEIDSSRPARSAEEAFARLDEWRRTNPLKATGRKSDKAFFDRMWGEV